MNFISVLRRMATAFVIATLLTIVLGAAALLAIERLQTFLHEVVQHAGERVRIGQL